MDKFYEELDEKTKMMIYNLFQGVKRNKRLHLKTEKEKELKLIELTNMMIQVKDKNIFFDWFFCAFI